MPAARPSRPSIRLTAFAMPTTQSTVISGARSGDSTTKSANGTRKKSIVTPASESTLPDRTCPASLAGGDTSRMSSSSPTEQMIAAARTTPSGSVDPVNTALKPCRPGSTHATPMAARKPKNMAAPPRVGVGRSWTRRSSGWTTAPIPMASRRRSGVVTNVTSAATAKTIPYPMYTRSTRRSR